jgi:tight adherence protein C
MALLITVTIFLATVLAALALYWWLEGRRETLPRRFEEIVGSSKGDRGANLSTAAKWIGKLRMRFATTLGGETELVERLSGKELTGSRLLLTRAGYRGVEAPTVYLIVRWVAPVALAVLAFVYGKFSGSPSRSIFIITVSAGILGFIIPDILLRLRIRQRVEEITNALPDGLDLLVVCIEAGLGMNAAFIKITEEFRLSSPALSEEFDVLAREMLAGKSRPEAMHSLADRTGVEDVKSLVAMLIQTDKLGTSLAQSLRVHSDSLRVKRRQRAEEAGAKTTIKLIFPLVFLLFPALFIVILGPAFLQIFHSLLPGGK